MNCASCNQQIPEARLEALPETTVCVECSTVKPYRAIVNVSVKHKVIEVIPTAANDPIFDYIDDLDQGRPGRPIKGGEDE